MIIEQFLFNKYLVALAYLSYAKEKPLKKFLVHKLINTEPCSVVFWNT